MLQWFRRCLDAERLVQADAEALIRDPQRESGAMLQATFRWKRI
jgi:hypothetical protein